MAIREVSLSKSATLVEARKALEPLLRGGAICPCCNQRAKVQRRPFSEGAAYLLIVLWHNTDEDRLSKPFDPVAVVTWLTRYIRPQTGTSRRSFPGVRSNSWEQLVLWGFLRKEGAGYVFSGPIDLSQIADSQVSKYAEFYTRKFVRLSPEKIPFSTVFKKYSLPKLIGKDYQVPGL